jgi:hypothetical protein
MATRVMTCDVVHYIEAIQSLTTSVFHFFATVYRGNSFALTVRIKLLAFFTGTN